MKSQPPVAQTPSVHRALVERTLGSNRSELRGKVVR